MTESSSGLTSSVLAKCVDLIARHDCAKKCTSFEYISLLGYIVSANHVKLNINKIESFEARSEPIIAKQVQQCLELFNCATVSNHCIV